MSVALTTTAASTCSAVMAGATSIASSMDPKRWTRTTTFNENANANAATSTGLRPLTGEPALIAVRRENSQGT